MSNPDRNQRPSTEEQRGTETTPLRRFQRPITRLLPTQESRELAVVMLLPIPSGIYAAFVLSGGLATIEGVIQVGALIFGGNAAAAIILSKFHRERREELKWVGVIGAVLVPAAGLTAVFAPLIQRIIHESLFAFVTAGVIILIAIQSECESLAYYIPRIETLGLLTVIIAICSALINLIEGVPLRLSINYVLVVKSIAAAVIGIGFVTVLVTLRHRVQNRVDMTKLQTGCAIALTFVALDLVNIVSGTAAIIALAATVLFSLEHDSTDHGST